jgi:glycerol-3-phosphate cytidylyltransferase
VECICPRMPVEPIRATERGERVRPAMRPLVCAPELALQGNDASVSRVQACTTTTAPYGDSDEAAGTVPSKGHLLSRYCNPGRGRPGRWEMHVNRPVRGRDDKALRVVTFGTFDVFHLGHLRLLERARAYGDELHVGISTDELNQSKKGRVPVFDFSSRSAIVAALRCVTGVFAETSLELKREYLLDLKAHVLVMGDDWKGRFDELGDVCRVVYLPRTPSVSTTATIEKIQAR